MKKLWGSRFKEPLADDAKYFSYSLHVDKELLAAEIEVSQVHAAMLARVKLISSAEGKKLVAGLRAVLKDLENANFAALANNYEDVHALVQDKLEKKIGAVAKKIHTGRSRNDLVSTSTRVYLRGRIEEVVEAITGFQQCLVDLAEKYGHVAIPAYTHLQRAQPVLFAHHLLAYVCMLERDIGRLTDAVYRLNECPLGAGAVSGSALPLDRKFVAERLGFFQPSANSMDAVSDRDYIAETLSALALLFVHLSRFSEDVIFWNSSECGFVELPDAYATGSSLMPHKKNPDMAELTRGRSGAVIGSLVAVLTMLKGLPLSYNRDMQEDKQAVFESLNLSLMTLPVLGNMISGIRVREAVCMLAVSDSLLYTTDLVDYLILKGISFRDAHEMVGKMVRYATGKEKMLKSLSLAEFKRFSTKIDKEIHHIFSPEKSLARKKTVGSTNPTRVSSELRKWRKKLDR